MKQFFIFFFIFASFIAVAQDAATLYQTGKSFLQQGDYDNAILVLKRACAAAPNTLEYEKDLANAYFFKGDYDNAKTIVEKLTEREDGDAYIYLLAGNISRSKADPKTAEKFFRKGLKKFDENGMLYNALGEILWDQKDYSAIKQWEKGIQADPGYAGNYYNAALYYFLTKDINEKIWSIYYGEIFVNLESYTTRTLEVKGMILNCYKRIFLDENFFKAKTNNKFETAFKQSLEKQEYIVANGIRTESLIMIRTLFILDWFYEVNKPKSSLYEKQQQLLKEGLFEAYNYWLFESVTNLASFEKWSALHKTEYQAFTKYNQNRVFKVDEKEYYK